MPSSDVPVEERASSDLLGQSRRVIRRHLVWLVVLALLTGAAVAELTRLRPSTHVSTVSFVVQTTSGASDTETLIRTMQALVDSEIIGADLAEAAGVELAPEQVVDRLTVSRPPGAGVFTVEVTDSDEERSLRLAEQLIPVFQERVRELSRPEPGELSVTYSIRAWGSGAVSTSVIEPPVTRNAVLGLVLGGILGMLLLAARGSVRPVLINVAQAAAAYRLPLLGGVLSQRGPRPCSPAALRALLARRNAGWPESPRSVVVITSREVPQRPALLATLARVLHPTSDVVLVDATGDRGSLTSAARGKHRPGVVQVLDGGVDVDDALVPFEAEEAGPQGRSAPVLRVLPRGEGDLVSSASAHLPLLVSRLQRHSAVLVDVGDLDEEVDWAPLLQEVDAVLVVGKLGATTVREATEVGDALLAMTDRPVGVLLVGTHRLLVPTDAGAGLTPPTAGQSGEPVLSRGPYAG